MAFETWAQLITTRSNYAFFIFVGSQTAISPWKAVTSIMNKGVSPRYNFKIIVKLI